MSFAGYATVRGTEATLRGVTLGTYDPKTGKATDTEVDTTVHGVLQQYRVDELGEGIDTEDRKYLLPASEVTTEPTTEDRLVIGSVLYEIVTVGRIEKHGVAHIYLLQIRRIK